MEHAPTPPITAESAAAVEADIRAELEAHLALCEEELIAEGCTPEHARELARLRFGDFDRTARACRNQKLRGRMMLQRIHLATTALLFAAVVWFGLQAHSNARVVKALKSSAVAAAPLELEPVIIERDDQVWLRDERGNRELDLHLKVASDGTVLVPELGHIKLAGMTRDEAEAHLMELYAPYYAELLLRITVGKAR